MAVLEQGRGKSASGRNILRQSKNPQTVEAHTLPGRCPCQKDEFQRYRKIRGGFGDVLQEENRLASAQMQCARPPVGGPVKKSRFQGEEGVAIGIKSRQRGSLSLLCESEAKGKQGD